MADSPQPASKSPDFTLVRLSDLVDQFDPDEVQGLLDSFVCSKNSDVESFLHTTATLIEESDKGRTYLAVTTSSYESPDSPLEILGYFTLALKYLPFGPGGSNSMKKKLNGLSSGVEGVAGYLIGQLGRNDNAPVQIAGSALLDAALDQVSGVRDAIGGRFVIVECEQNPKLISFYENNSFIRIPNDPNDSMAQLFHLLRHAE